jgi:hypothetical protein
LLIVHYWSASSPAASNAYRISMRRLPASQ